MRNIPEWTELSLSRGLDPLGMQNSCIRLYQNLVPGIGNVTNRLRYYGFYAWLADVYARKIGIPDKSRWQIFLRRAEALYAGIAVRASEAGGVAGSLHVTKVLNSLTDGQIFDLSKIADRKDGEKQYLQQAFGAFGAAYGGQLYEVSILAENRELGIPNPSKELGDNLATIFENSIGDSGELFFTSIEHGCIAVKDLDALANMSPDRIIPSSEECLAYHRILFAEKKFKSSDESREVTLKLLVRAANYLGRKPKSSNEFRWLIFSDDKFLATQDKLMSEREKHQLKLWTIYHASDLLHVCYETFLRLLIDQLAISVVGLAANEAISQTIALNFAAHSDLLKQCWNDFDENVSESKTDYELAIISLSAGEGGGRTPDNDAGMAALILLHRLYNRFAGDFDFISEVFSSEGLAAQTLSTECRFLEDRQFQEVGVILRDLFKTKVLNRHLWIAMRKFARQNDYTFLIESDDGLLRCRKLGGPVLTNPRLDPALTFLTDANLFDKKGASHAAKKIMDDI